ncbi:MAG TPA: hypothetical protein VI321_02655 [Burkholderiales bacterium]
MRLLPITLLCLCCVARAQAWQAIKGEALPGFFAGRELGDDAHFAYRFAEDQSFSGTEMGRDVRGRWRVMGGKMCWKWIVPAQDEECYQVEHAGDEVRMLKNGSEAWAGRLRPAGATARRP